MHNAEVIRYGNNYYASKPDNSFVGVFDRDNLDQPFFVIGQVSNVQNSIRDQQKVMESMKQAARELGGDALIDLETDRQNVSHDWIPSYETQYTALVIRFQ